MTDNEVVKAIEFCAADGNVYCEDCPFYEKCLNDENLFKPALELINRLQAEKQNLEIDLKAMRGAANCYKAENERLKEVNDSFTNIGKLYSEIKSEAYKEFAERLKEQAKANEWNGTICGVDIDNLLKEMGDKDNG